MRILLIQAFTALKLELVWPIGLASLAAHLPEEYDVEIFDVNLYRGEGQDPYEALRAKVMDFAPDVVGISLRNIKVGTPGVHTNDFEPQQKSVALIREAAPKAKIVVGGTAFSLYSETFMEKLPAADMGVWGEAEHRFPELLRNLETPENVRGVYYRRDGEIVYTGTPGVLTFPELKWPRKDLISFEPYAASSFASIGLQSKRGCALHCVHCSDTYLLGNKVRLRPARDVVDEMEQFVYEHNVKQLFFCDQIFNIPVRHAIDICKEIVDRKLEVKWAAWFNEKINTLPDELIIWLKRAGCGLLSFSPDHVDDRMLRNLDKNFRYKDLVYTYQIAKKHDIDVEYSFFLNAPGEDFRSLANIMKFIVEARLHAGKNFRLFTLLLLQPIRLYPHSRMHDLAQETGLIDVDSDLITGEFWNTGPVSYAVAGIQASALATYKMRQRYKDFRGINNAVL